MLYRATKDFEFGGVKVVKGEAVPCHRPPWSTLLSFGAMYVEPAQDDGPARATAVATA